VKLSAFVALIVGFPLIAVQIWLFVAPGLYRQEKKAFLPFLIATPFMFYAGCAVMYYVVLPYVINLMLAVYVPADIEKTLRSSDYLERVLQLVFAPNGDALAAATQLTVQGALQQWLGDLIQVNAVNVQSEDSTLSIFVSYTVRQTQQQQVAQFVQGGPQI
jgi:hypothetical protein